MAVRGNKVGVFKGQAFYLLPGGKCRHGSTGRMQSFQDFCRALSQEDQKALLAMIEGTQAAVVEATVIGAEVKAADPQPEIATIPEFEIFPDGRVRKNGQEMPLAEYLGTLPKGDARKVRRLCRSLGMLGLAATKSEK